MGIKKFNSSIINSNEMATVSGISSGGYMAVQLHIAYSSIFSGAGIIAGGPYFCANMNMFTAQSSCMKDPEFIVLDELYEATLAYESTFVIDSTKNLSNDRVWLFSGTEDDTVHQGVMKKLYSYYNNYISEKNIHSVFNYSASHAFITNNWGNACNYKGSPFINNCDLDAAKAILSWTGNQDLKPATPANISNVCNYRIEY
eukprot:TRINITY_DN6892_c0_g1_i1.p1 TRINITY_DN6892_c0_g1~~TRINITY_DN6892_c0_g1_i1.p1  ORF type:complete len:221 (-),score=23.48 TRINITY_DN6892_c0_g1_i1:413-1015(-)